MRNSYLVLLRVRASEPAPIICRRETDPVCIRPYATRSKATVGARVSRAPFEGRGILLEFSESRILFIII